MRKVALVTILLALLCPASFLVAESGKTDSLELYRDLPRDPLLVMAVHLDRPAEQLARLVQLLRNYGTEDHHAELASVLEQLETDAGFSLRQGLLERVGPELALALDLPPVDVAVGAMQLPTGEAWGVVLRSTGFVARVREPRKVEGSLEILSAVAGYELVDRDGLKEIRFPLEGDDKLSVYYGMRAGRLAVGFAPDWVESALDTRPEGKRLIDGDDFRRVFGQLDARPSDLTYVNLPRLRHYIAGSQVVQLALEAQPEARQFVQRFFTEDTMGIGLGSTTVRVEGGVRTTNFGPSWMSGTAVSSGVIAAMAVPNLFAAMDRGKTRETVGDIQSIAEACEGFSGDSRLYPGPTEGWVPVEKIAMFLEPVYISALPRTDGWEHPILYWSDGASYRILSTGRDGMIDRDWSGVMDPTASANMDGDIVFADGRFLVIPEQLIEEE